MFRQGDVSDGSRRRPRGRRAGLRGGSNPACDVPLGYPAVLGEVEEDHGEADDWLSADKRRFFSGPLELGPPCSSRCASAPEPSWRLV